MDQTFLDQGKQNPVLGPHYFAAQAVAEDFMAKFEANNFAPLIKKFADEMYGKLIDSLESHLLSDVESNIQGTIWRQIDASVAAILSGDKWAIDRYALGDRYDHGKIRAQLAALIPSELISKRLTELEAENEKLRNDLEWERRR